MTQVCSCIPAAQWTSAWTLTSPGLPPDLSAPARLSWFTVTGVCPPEPEREALLDAVSCSFPKGPGCRQSCVQTVPLMLPAPCPGRCPLVVFLAVLSLSWSRMDLGSLPSCWSELSPLKTLQWPKSHGLEQLSRPPGAGHLALYLAFCACPVIS